MPVAFVSLVMELAVAVPLEDAPNAVVLRGSALEPQDEQRARWATKGVADGAVTHEVGLFYALAPGVEGGGDGRAVTACQQLGAAFGLDFFE